MNADEKRKNGENMREKPDEDKKQKNAMTADGSDGHASLHLEIPKKTNFLTLHSNEFEIHTSSLVLQNGTVLNDLKVEKKSILLNVRLPCEIEPQKDAKFIFTFNIKLTNKVHDMPEITLQIDPRIQAIVDKAKETGRKATADDLGDLTSDSNFLNNLQSGVNKWINEIRKITRLDYDLLSGTALQEATFWTSIEKELHHINEMRESEEVLLTLEALKLGKRFHATVSLDADTGLKEMLSRVADYNRVMMMMDLPLNDLMSAGDVDAIRLALVGVLACFKEIRNTKYPAKRAMDLFSVISADTCNQMIKVLRPQRLMHMEIGDFDAVMQACTKVFTYWDDEQQNHLQAIFREMAKKQKYEVKFTYRIPLQHKSLEARLDDVHKFRWQHEHLSGAIARVMRASGHGRKVDFYSDQNNPAKQVAKAYDDVKEVDCLNITKEGVASWESAMNRYREQISRIETQLAIRIREQLGNARNGDEMFSIFSHFNALFVRPHIRSAIREFQTQLIEYVKRDIDELTTVHLSEDGTNRGLEGFRRLDIPETSARIMWYRQIESHLDTYMKRVDDVLGDQWAKHIDGRELMMESERLRQKLDTKPIFDDWIKRVDNKCKTSNGRLYVIEKLQKEGKVVHHLKVDYALEMIVIAKEVDNLKNMGFRLPFKIMSLAHSASNTYPYAISLLESVRNYDATNEKVFARKGVGQLVVYYRRAVHELLTEGYVLTWDNYWIETYVARMADATNIYNEKVNDLIEALDGINVDMKALDTCQYSESVIGQLLASIQKRVDQLVVGKYSNLKRWVNEVDRTVESKLARRVEEAIHVWTKALSGPKNELEEDEKEKKIQPDIVRMKLEIRVSSQLITAIPPLEKARFDLLSQFYAWHSIASNQPRIVPGQFKLRQRDVPTYKSVMTNMQHRERIMDEVLESINSRMAKVGEYVNQWTQYQALWDLQSDSLYERLGDELQNWMTALVEIKAARSQVDTQESEFEIFPFVIDYAQVQTKISVKYEHWQREVLQKFGTLLGSNMQKFYTELSKWRSDFEQQSTDSTSTNDTVALITYVQTLKKHVKPYQEQVNKFIAGQKLLSHNRYQFPKAWLYAEHVEGEWSALMEILSRKDVSIQSQVGNLQSRVSEEDRVLERHIDEMLAEWKELKPVQGTSRPRDSISTLRAFDERFKKMRDDLTSVTKAKTVLEMSEGLGLPGGDQNKIRLDNSMEELQNLLGVWQALSPIYEALNAEKEKLWSTIQPRKIRTFLDERLTELKNLPSRYRSYEAYEHAKRLLQHYIGD